MRHLVPMLLFVVVAGGLTGLAAHTVNRGPFQRGLTTVEIGAWTEATSDDARNISPYGRILGALAQEGPTAIQDTRRLQTLVFLPLFALGVFALAWRRAGPWGAAGAGIAATAVAPATLHAGSFHPGLLAGGIGLLALAALNDGARWGGWIAAALLGAVIARLDPALGWALFVLLAGYAWVSRSGPPRWVRLAVVAGLWLGVGAGLGTLTPQGVLPQVNGFEAYQGNGTPATGLNPRRTADPPLSWWTASDFVRGASLEQERGVTFQEAERFWRGKAARSPLSDPLGTLRRSGLKSLAALQSDPLPHGVSTAYLLERTESATLPVTVWMARILLPLGIVGVVLARRRMGGAVWLGVLSGVVAAWFTYAAPEGRAITVGALLVAGAVLVRWSGEGPMMRRVAAGGVGILAVALFGLWVPRALPGMAVQSEDAFQLGALYDQEGRGSTALREYERAMRLDPQSPTPRFAIAGMLARDNVLPESRRELEFLREQNPDFYAGLLALSRVYQQLELYVEAAGVYGDLIRLDPYNPELLNNLGTLYVQIGYFEQAMVAFRNALALAPDYTVAQENLAALEGGGISSGSADGRVMTDVSSAQEIIIGRLGAGDAEGAESALAEARDRFGDAPELDYAEGTLWLINGDPARAVAVFENALDTPLATTVVFRNNLGAAYMAAGETCKAICIWKLALADNPNNRRVQLSVAQAQAEADSVGTVCDCGDTD